MNVQPTAAASLAGTIRAAARGGNREEQMTAESKSAAAETNDSNEPQAEASGESEDRGGDGRQVLDRFEKSEDEADQESQSASEGVASGETDPESRAGGLDLLA